MTRKADTLIKWYAGELVHLVHLDLGTLSYFLERQLPVIGGARKSHLE